MELSNQRSSCSLCAEAEITGVYVLFYIPQHLGPPIVLGYQFQHLPSTRVSYDLGVMV